jgi:NAD+ synthase
MANEIKVSPKLDSFKLALAQLNPVVGDIDSNLKKARTARAEAAAKGADLIAFTELYLTGYPIEDLVLKPAFQSAAREACEAFARDTADGGPAVLVGLPGRGAFRATTPWPIWISGRIEASGSNTICPNYGCIRREAVFAPGPLAGTDRGEGGFARRAGV